MRFRAFATDYDGTLAHNGLVNESTLDALRRLKATERKLILVTGRVLPELFETFPQVDLFDRIVAENGALLYNPATKEERTLSEPPAREFARRLASAGVGPISCGRVIVATWEPHEKTVLSIIHEMGLELQVIFNKGAVMILPSGINKASGLKAVLDEFALLPDHCVAIGDAENDHALLSLCACSVAVANAIDSVKARADIVTVGDHGDGVIEIIDQLLLDDLESKAPAMGQRRT